MNKHRLLWPPWPDELVGPEEVAFASRGINRSDEQLALPIAIDRNGVIEKVDDDGATAGRAAEERHPGSLGAR